MYHLDNVSGVPEMPEPKDTQSISPRWFGESQEQGGVSWPGADWFNTVQAELLNLMAAAGIEPDKKSFNQLSQAIPILGDARIRQELGSDKGTLLVFARNGLNVQQYVDCVSHISILEFIKPSKRKYLKYLNDPTTAEQYFGDMSEIITEAMRRSAFCGKPLVFCGPEADEISSSIQTGQSWFFPVSQPLVQPEGCVILAAGIGKHYLVPTNDFPEQHFLLSWPPGMGQPRMCLDGLGFSGGNYKSRFIGGFAVQRGVYTSYIRNLFIRDCYHGGLLIKPQNTDAQTVASDIVNLDVSTIFILNSGNPEHYQAFDIQFSSEWGSGNWTDGSVRFVDISTSFADNAEITQSPISLNLYNFNKQIFNVLFQRFYTSAKANTHLKIYSNSPIRNTNLSFLNFSGDGIVKTSLPMLDIYGLGFSHVGDVYRGSLINGGLRIANATDNVFSNMVFGSSTDSDGVYQKQIRIEATAANTMFRDCTLRDPFGTSTPYNYRKWFTEWVDDAGVNTQWESSQFRSNVVVQRAFDFFNTVTSGKCINASSQHIDITATQSEGHLQLSYPASSGAASPGVIFPIPSNLRQGVTGDDYVYVMLKVSCSSATLGVHRLSINLFDTQIRWAPESTGNDVFLMGRFPVNTSAANASLRLELGSASATTSPFTVQIKEIAITSGALPWAPNYRKTLQVM